MGLIHYEQLEDDWDASANLWNERFGILFNEINGNIDTVNIKNGAITSAKIAPGAVTSDKMFVEKYIDDRGWTVEDYGSTKDYYTRKTGTITVNPQQWTRINQEFPIGISSVNEAIISMATHSDWTELLFTIVPAAGNDKIYINVFNTHPNQKATNIPYKIDFNVKRL